MSNTEEEAKGMNIGLPVANATVVTAPTDDEPGVALLFMVDGTVRWVSVAREEEDS